MNRELVTNIAVSIYDVVYNQIDKKRYTGDFTDMEKSFLKSEYNPMHQVLRLSTDSRVIQLDKDLKELDVPRGHTGGINEYLVEIDHDNAKIWMSEVIFDELYHDVEVTKGLGERKEFNAELYLGLLAEDNYLDFSNKSLLQDRKMNINNELIIETIRSVEPLHVFDRLIYENLKDTKDSTDKKFFYVRTLDDLYVLMVEGLKYRLLKNRELQKHEFVVENPNVEFTFYYHYKYKVGELRNVVKEIDELKATDGLEELFYERGE